MKGNWNLFKQLLLYPYREFRVLKSSTFKEVMGILSQAMGYREDQLRIWPFSQRTNQTYRPTVLELDEPGKSVSDVGRKKVKGLQFCFLCIFVGYLSQLPSCFRFYYEGTPVYAKLLCYECILAKTSPLLYKLPQGLQFDEHHFFSLNHIVRFQIKSELSPT